MSNLTYIDDVPAAIIDRLPAFLHGVKTLAVLTSIGNLLQGWEDLYEDLRSVSVQDGTEYLLDVVGSWVDVDRDGDEDPSFRARVLAQIVVNQSGGQRESILQLLRIIRGEKIRFWNLGGGWGQVNYQMASAPVVTEHQAAQIVDLMVNPGAVMTSSYSVKPFGFAGNPNAFGFGAGHLGIAGVSSSGGINI